MNSLSDQHRKRLAYIGMILLPIVAGFFYYVHFLMTYGYLPSPFMYDKSDTFMDFFNPLYWAYDSGRYTDWGSVYPPLSFGILRLVNFVLAGGGYGDPDMMRDYSQSVIIGFCLLYLAAPAILLNTKHWQDFAISEKFLIYFVIILSTPMLFTLERGNILLLCPILLSLVLLRIGFLRCFCIALLINIKPYFALLMIYYIARRNWNGLATCVVLSGLIFILSGLALDNNFLVFFTNLFNFSQDNGVFSLREVLALPSSISAFSYVLKNPDGAMFASDFLNPERIIIIIYIIEAIKWGVLAISLAVLFTRSALLRDAEVFSLLVVAITNLGIWVGGYTFIFYIALTPVFIKMRGRWLYIGLLSILAMPLDIIPLLSSFIGQQYSYLSDSYIDIQWTLGLGSAIRPVVNLILLLLLSGEFLARKHRGVHNSVLQRADILVGASLWRGDY
ncbi:MAG: glycosyltransferase 87 family protein [Sulfuricaulis sp.]